MTIDDESLMRGYRNFRRKYAAGDESLMARLAHGQSPRTMVLGCIDSRADPALILQCDPGDILVARNIAAIVAPRAHPDAATLAALEFGVRYLQVERLILLGHSDCGGIKALLGAPIAAHNEHIDRWLAVLGTEVIAANDPDKTAQNALLASYANCLTYPWIRARRDAGRLQVHLWFFDIASGTVRQFDHAGQRFVPL